MYLTRLSLTNFRTFTRLELEIPRHSLLLVGDNAQGKTSLLEAVYYLATFASLQAQHDRQLINFLTREEPLAVARLLAEFTRSDGNHRLEIRLIQEGGGNGGSRLRKEILVNGVKRGAADALGLFNAVIFLPQMTRILENGPEERRRYLNLALAQALPGYGKALSEYHRVVTQRNALLKQLSERGGDRKQLEYWDDLLTRSGAFIIHARIQAIEELENLAARFHQRLSHGAEMLRLVYQPSYDPLPEVAKQPELPLEASLHRTGIGLERIQVGFREKLERMRNEEIARGVTCIGPHRDDLRFLTNDIDLADYGSRGQVRTALLALKLAEVAWLKEKTSEWPVLLLDEILAELDQQHRADLLKLLSESEQALLTTTDMTLFPVEFTGRTTVWRVEQGQVSAAGTMTAGTSIPRK